MSDKSVWIKKERRRKHGRREGEDTFVGDGHVGMNRSRQAFKFKSCAGLVCFNMISTYVSHVCCIS